MPYQGNLAKADIFILLLNPGLGLSDYYTQDNKPHSEALKKIFFQDFSKTEYPFLSLDLQFSWSGGFIWWERKLRRLLRKIADEHFDGNYVHTLKSVSQRLAAIELFPYHSKTFNHHRLLRELPSVLAAQHFTKSVLVGKAQKGEATIIAMRQITAFNLPEHENIIQYRGSETRAAHLGPDSRAGEAILKHIKNMS